MRPTRVTFEFFKQRPVPTKYQVVFTADCDSVMVTRHKEGHGRREVAIPLKNSKPNGTHAWHICKEADARIDEPVEAGATVPIIGTN